MTWELVAMIAVLAVVAAFVAVVVIALLEENKKQEHQRWMEREELKLRKAEHNAE